MIKIFLIELLLFVAFTNCRAQESITLDSLTYLGSIHTKTHNKNFVNKQLIFLQGKDSIMINQKLPINDKNVIADYGISVLVAHGIYHSWHFKTKKHYTFKLKKTCLNNIPKEYNTYYNTNTIIYSLDNCYVFKEILKDTHYLYQRNYSYVDINNVLYEVIYIIEVTNGAINNSKDKTKCKGE